MDFETMNTIQQQKKFYEHTASKTLIQIQISRWPAVFLIDFQAQYFSGLHLSIHPCNLCCECPQTPPQAPQPRLETFSPPKLALAFLVALCISGETSFAKGKVVLELQNSMAPKSSEIRCKPRLPH